MSGPIRQKLGPTSKLLKDRLDALKSYAIPSAEAEETKEQLVEHMEDLIDDLDEDLRKINDWSQSLATLDQQWQALMAQEEDNGVESKQFTTFIAKNDYTVCMIQGQAKVSELEKMRSKLLRALNKLKKEAGQEAVNSTSPLRMTMSTPLTHHQLEASHTPVATTPAVAPTIQLPKMSMRTYNGDYRDWMPFKNWFTVTIMSQPLSPLQMFMYLHSCLEKGSTAEQAIAAISITEENFKLAWDTLEKVCGDQKKIIRNHWRTLQKHSITTLQNASNSELRKRLDSIKLAVSQLKQAGEEIESRSVQILIEQNWPPKVMERLIDKEATTSTEMLQALDDILKRQEEIYSLCYGEERKPNQTTKNSSQPKLNEHISSAMFVGSSKKKNDKKLGKNKKEARGPYCILHEIEGHWSNECKAYPDDEAKKHKLKEEKRCTICTSKKHTQCERKVSCALCKGDHHHIFHKESKKPSKKPMSSNSIAVEETHAGSLSVNSAFDIKGNKQKMLYLVEVNVFNPLNPSKQVKTLAILDNGAEQSFVHADITNKLNIKGQKKKLYLSTFGSKDVVSVDSFIVNLGFQIFDGSNIQMEVRSIGFMMRPIQTVLATANVDMEAKCLEPKLYQPQILIGIDLINEILLSFRQRLPSRFWRQSTIFGPVIGGKGFTVNGMNEAEFSENSNTMSMFMLAEPHHERDLQVEAQLENLVKTQYEIDKIGISDSPEKSADDIEATKILHEHMRIDENGRIEVPLLWKKGTLKVPKNRALAYGRFVSEVKKLSKNPDHLREYDRIIREYIESGICEVVEDENKLDGPFESFLPHHSVIKENSNTTKIRKVNDASASIGNGPSLNDNIYKGKSKIPDAVGFFMRFRWHKKVMVMDIQKAFLQLSVRKCDRDVLRFFWLKRIDRPISPDNTLIARYGRLPFGVICAPGNLDEATDFLMSLDESKVAKIIKDNKYVDNICLGGDTTEDLLLFYHEAKRIFAKAHMNVREFLSNDAIANSQIPEVDRMVLSTENAKILGIPWDYVNDKIVLELKTPEDNCKPVTKRQVLKQIAKCYDPNGFMSPLLLTAKIFNQSLWLAGYEWDQQVTSIEVEKWRRITQDWSNFKKTIDRCISGSKQAVYQLHAFCDGSVTSFATAIILRVEEPDGQASTHLVFAKSRLKPIKGLSIPRMELMGVVTGHRALHFVEKQLRQPISEKFIWTDSTAVLGWIFSTKKQEVFIENRMKELRSDPKLEYRHVCSADNTADCATRGLPSSKLIDFDLWWFGPNWLQQAKENWPNSEFGGIPEILKHTEEIGTIEVQPEESATLSIIEPTIVRDNTDIEPFPIDLSKFSSLHKLIRHIVLILRWKKVANFQKLHKNQPGLQTPDSDASDYEEALQLLLKRAQQEKPPSESQIKQLDLKIDKANLRERYWLPQGSKMIMNIIKKNCFTCRRYDARPFKLPPMPPLPTERITRAKAFQFCAIDNYGPVWIRIEGIKKKIAGVIFTCLVTRMTALDVATDMSTFTFIQTLQRLIARFGKPSRIYSDHGTNFKLAMKSFAAENGIEWSRITTNSPWSGGVYEAIVKLTKNCLRRCIGRQLMDYNSFITLIAQTESVLNSRPLTYVSDTVDDCRVIRPIDFVNYQVDVKTKMLTDFDSTNDSAYKPEITSREQVLEIVAQEEKYLNRLWIDFYSFYLKALRERHRMEHKQPKNVVPRPPQVGEVVILYEECAPRAEWKLGRVSELKQSSDGEIRAVKVRTPNGKELERPVNLIYPLEIVNEIADKDSSETTENASKLNNHELEKPEEDKEVKERQQQAIDPYRAKLRPRNQAKFSTMVNHMNFFFFIMSICGLFCITRAQDFHLVAVNCVPYGINLVIATEVTQIKAFVKPICLDKRNPSSLEFFQLPAEILMYQQRVTVRYWSGTKEFIMNSECPRHDFCSIQDCLWCWRIFLYLFQCIPWWLEMIFALVGLAILYCLIKCCDAIGKIVEVMQKAWKFLKKILIPIWHYFVSILSALCPCFGKIRWFNKKNNLKNNEENPLLEPKKENNNMLPFHHPTAERRRRNWPIQIPIWRLSAMVIQAYIFGVAYARDPRECAETFTIIASENRAKGMHMESSARFLNRLWSCCTQMLKQPALCSVILKDIHSAY
uniref:Integrase catalytic domain-containing protein n=1 Tax=Acrobeloides nanus TaxID=290746 RepID=A0A914EKC3_9BILA